MCKLSQNIPLDRLTDKVKQTIYDFFLQYCSLYYEFFVASFLFIYKQYLRLHFPSSHLWYAGQLHQILLINKINKYNNLSQAFTFNRLNHLWINFFLCHIDEQYGQKKQRNWRNTEHRISPSECVYRMSMNNL